ncbi:MAG: hypothetical protein IT270_04855 [Saprospiraceae bacterium]|nr:hypothetical protein [Saprospiraceae bacterium]
MMYFVRFLVLLPMLLAMFTDARAQKRFPEHPEGTDFRNKGSAILLHLNGGFHIPAGDMADRFGSDGSAGLGLERLGENNWIIGGETYYFFGGQVKEDPLDILRTPEGEIIGNDRLVASVVLRERGFYAGALVGRMFPIEGTRSGLRVTLGAGWLQHKIRVQDDSRTVTQLTGDYLKGYDRLTAGLALNEFIGYQSLGAQGRINWYAGFEFNQGFTNTRREWDFSDRRKLDENRLDLRIGIRFGWTLPFYTSMQEKIYY